MHLAAVRKREKELFISHVYKSGAVEVINDHHHSQIISCDMCPFRFWAGGRDHLSSWLIKRAPWVSVSGLNLWKQAGPRWAGQGWGVMSHLTAGSRSCVWEANNIAAIFSPERFLHVWRQKRKWLRVRKGTDRISSSFSVAAFITSISLSFILQPKIQVNFLNTRSFSGCYQV